MRIALLCLSLPCSTLWATTLPATAWQQSKPAALPLVEVTGDNFDIDHSCVVRIAPGLVIADPDDNGVLHVVADGVQIYFEKGTVLRGAADATHGATLTGIGVRIDGHKNVSLFDFEVRGFRCGILATKADGLVVKSAYLHHNFRQHLKSTPAAEDSGDWLWPHENDEQQWRRNYGAGLCVERSKEVVIDGLRVREQQNGIILDRVEHSSVVASDSSFLSGWGLAMWRSCDNKILNNRFDFNIRGYSHGVYNRGQDSAGILMFEQCSRNVIAKNSITHCGDGIFAFSGREALGEANPPGEDFSYLRRGNNDNIFWSNHLSYAAAHGLELTFGFGNKIEGNSFVANAICGFWGGYSQDTTLSHNTFKANGDAGYGLERGAINIDHSRNNHILHNTFDSTTCSVHLWSHASALTETPWGKANNMEASGNLLVSNRFSNEVLGVQLRGEVELAYGNNTGSDGRNLVTEIAAQASWIALQPDAIPAGRSMTAAELADFMADEGERQHQLGGREAIIMTEWGPWDHQAPLLRKVGDFGARHEYEMLPVGSKAEYAFADPASAKSFGLQLKVENGRAIVIATGAGYAEYQLIAQAANQYFEASGWFMLTDWQVQVFPSPCDPRGDVSAWRAAAESEAATRFTTPQLNLIYGMSGPSGLPQLKDRGVKIGNEAFGTIAKTSVKLAPGTWRFKVRSDDGVRILVDGEVLLENWTWHAPTVNEALLEIADAQPRSIVVEHFELDGYATLELQIVPLP